MAPAPRVSTVPKDRTWATPGPPVLGSTAPVAYLPVLLVVSVFTGALTGFVAAVLFSAMEKAKIAPGS